MSDAALEFLRSLYPRSFSGLMLKAGEEPPKLVIWVLDPRTRKSRCFWLDSVEAAIEIALKCRESEHVFFGVTLQKLSEALALARRHRPNAGPESVRGRIESAAVLTAIWVDLDVADPTHASDHLPADLEIARGLLKAVPHPASALIKTGSGLHAYWFLEDPWILASEADRQGAAALVARVQGAIRRLAEQQGLSVDATADLARAMRMPGTLNHKTPVPRPAEVELLMPERRYRPSDFDLLDVPSVPRTSLPVTQRLETQGRADLGQDYGPPADFVAIWKGCSFIRFCHQQQETLSYALWFAMITIVARCQAPNLDGVEIIHKMSERYVTYTREETDRKIVEALRPPGGPATCTKLASLGAYEDHCRHCPQWNGGTPKVKSPIVLGRPRALPVSTAGDPPRASDGQPSPPPPPSPRPSGTGGDDGSDGRVDIVISTYEKLVVDQILAVLVEREPNFFRRGVSLVQVIVDSLSGERPQHVPPASPVAHPITEPRLRELITQHIRCVKARQTKAGVEWRPVHPPRWLSQALIHRLEWLGVKRLEGLVEGPALRPDGSVLQSAGYDPASGLYLAPTTEFEPVPEQPTEEQTEAALLRLMEVVRDFPFAAECHFSAWLASLLTPLARFAFPGPSPVNLIDANVRGAGKSLLADVCHMIITGRPAARMPYVRDEAELRKQITAIALKARQLVVIDNVTGSFGSPTLDLAFTTTSWADRLLGQSVDLELPLAVTWYVTGNNIELSGDMPRRCLHIRLETPFEKPEHRQGFRHPRLLEWLAVERRRLLPAALTLLTAYRAAGSPPQDLRPWGSFEGWSDLIRGALVWLGLKDPALTCDVLESTADAAASTRKRLLEGLNELLTARGAPATVHEILETLDTHDGRTRFDMLCTALVEAFPRLKSGELPTPVQLGRKLRRLRERVVDGLCIVALEKTRKGLLWSVERRTSAAA